MLSGSRIVVGRPRFEDIPRFDVDVDLDAYLRACPRDATTRGTFFQHVCDATSVENGRDRARLFEGLSQQSWFPFKSYSLSDFMRLAYNAAVLGYPRVPTSEGLRRIGWMSYPSFASTMAGRVVLFALGNAIDDVVRAAPQAYRHSLPLAQVRVSQKGEAHYEIEMHRVHSFVEFYHCGVIEGAILAFGLHPEVTVHPLGRCDAQFDVRWGRT